MMTTAGSEAKLDRCRELFFGDFERHGDNRFGGIGLDGLLLVGIQVGNQCLYPFTEKFQVLLLLDLLVNVSTALGRCAEDKTTLQLIHKLDGVRLIWSLLKNNNEKVRI